MVYNPLPAVVLGGPPHRGKSVLAYSLTRALRERAVSHYLLRAYPPDGEGDWFHEGEQDIVRHLRIKGARSERWLPLLRRDVARRHFPLIVDMGGLPTPEQETVLDECTHGVLLTATEAEREEWAARFASHGLVLLADLRSDLHGEDRLEARGPVLRGVLSGLERGRTAAGPTFGALVDRLAELFQPFADTLYRYHMETAPTELVVDLERLAGRMERNPLLWEPSDLPSVLEYLPSGEPLALYGRGPNWLYAAVAVHALPAPFYLFDARLGWVAPPALSEGVPEPGAPLEVRVNGSESAARMLFLLPDAYLDVEEAEGMAVPVCPTDGLIIEGKLPLWLWAALARFYAPRLAWLAVVQPQLVAREAGKAVIISGRGGHSPGTVMLCGGVPFRPGA